MFKVHKYDSKNTLTINPVVWKIIVLACTFIRVCFVMTGRTTFGPCVILVFAVLTAVFDAKSRYGAALKWFLALTRM